MKNFPVLKLNENEKIISIFKLNNDSSVLLGTSQGRILKQKNIWANIYGTGERKISVLVQDGYENFSTVTDSNFLHCLYNQLIELNSDKDIVNTLENINAYAASKKEEITGVWTSSPLWAGNDFGYWGNIYLEQSVPGDSEASFFIRTASTSTGLASQEWKMIYSGDLASNTVNISEENSYAQIKIEMKMSTENVQPLIYKTTLSYYTKTSTLFFTKKFKLEKGVVAEKGFYTATFSDLPNTEIIFGVHAGNSADWDDYQVVEAEKFFDLPEGVENGMKIGIKLVSCDTTSVPVVDEFAFFVDGDGKTQVIDM